MNGVVLGLTLATTNSQSGLFFTYGVDRSGGTGFSVNTFVGYNPDRAGTSISNIENGSVTVSGQAEVLNLGVSRGLNADGSPNSFQTYHMGVGLGTPGISVSATTTVPIMTW